MPDPRISPLLAAHQLQPMSRELIRETCAWTFQQLTGKCFVDMPLEWEAAMDHLQTQRDVPFYKWTRAEASEVPSALVRGIVDAVKNPRTPLTAADIPFVANKAWSSWVAWNTQHERRTKGWPASGNGARASSN